MTVPAAGGPDATDQPRPGGPTDPPTPATRPYDPERGIRGALAATLVLEALTVLLAIPVARNTGSGTSTAGVVAIVGLAFAMIYACALVRRSYFVPVVVALQVLTVAGWFISGPLGAMGVIFAAVFGTLFWFRAEFRRRQAAGTLPTAP